MSATITSPIPQSLLIVVDSDQINVSWEGSTRGQVAYELQYKFKKADVWSTCGKVYSEEKSTSLNTIYDLVGVDFYELYYRVVIYYDGLNDLGSITGKESTDVYSIMFRHGFINTLKLYDGAITREIPVYDTIAFDPAKSGEDILIQKLTLDDTGENIIKMPLVQPNSAIKGRLKVCVDPETENIKTVAQEYPNFVASGLRSETYLTQNIIDDISLYSYGYIENYGVYGNYSTNTYYAYKPTYEYNDHYDYYEVYAPVPVYDYREAYHTGPTYDYITNYAYMPEYEYKTVDRYAQSYGYYSDYAIVDIYGTFAITGSYVSGTVPYYYTYPTYSVYYRMSYYPYSREYTYTYRGSYTSRKKETTYYSYYYISGYRQTSSTVQDGYYKTSSYRSVRHDGYYGYNPIGGMYSSYMELGYAKYAIDSKLYYNSRGGRRYQLYTYVTGYGFYYVQYTGYVWRYAAYSYYTYSVSYGYAPKYKTVYGYEAVYAGPSYGRNTTYYYETYVFSGNASGTYTAYGSNPVIEYRQNGYVSGYGGTKNLYDYQTIGYYYYYIGRSTGLYYGTYGTGNYYWSYSYRTSYISNYYEYISGYNVYYSGMRYDLYYEPFVDYYYTESVGYTDYVDYYYAYVTGQMAYSAGYYYYLVNPQYYVMYIDKYAYVSQELYHSYYYTYYRT